jgi:hypothetical protein
MQRVSNVSSDEVRERRYTRGLQRLQPLFCCTSSDRYPARPLICGHGERGPKARESDVMTTFFDRKTGSVSRHFNEWRGLFSFH